MKRNSDVDYQAVTLPSLENGTKIVVRGILLQGLLFELSEDLLAHLLDGLTLQSALYVSTEGFLYEARSDATVAKDNRVIYITNEDAEDLWDDADKTRRKSYAYHQDTDLPF